MRTWVVLLAVFSGCVDVIEHGVMVPLTVATSAGCDPGAEVKASQFHLAVHALGGLVTEQTQATVPTSLSLAPVPDAWVTIEALGAAGQVVARGVSAHVSVSTGQPTGFRVELFPVGRFTKVCRTLSVPRSAQTATRLLDGTVLIAGGLGRADQALSSMEQLSDGQVRGVGSLELIVQGTHLSFPRARHAATLLPNGMVVISGGELEVNGQPSPLSSTLFVDPTSGFAVGALGASRDGDVPRTRHAAVRFDTSLVLIGGLTTAVTPARSVQRLDVTSNQLSASGELASPRETAAITGLAGSVIIAGGLEGGVAQSKVDVLPAGDPTRSSSSSLRVPRANAAVAVLGPNALFAGGVDASGDFTGTTEWFGAQPADGPNITPRAQACAAVAGLEHVLVVGGTDAHGPSAAAELIGVDGSVVAVPFPGPGRVEHTCTTLEDGSVLIVGGTGAAGPLDDLWRFVAE